MKRILLIFSIFTLFCTALLAAPEFHPDLRYRLVCESNRQGCLTLGSKHGSTALLYYLLSSHTPEDGWWYIEKGSKGYSLRNAVTSEYIIRDPERIDIMKKGLALSPELKGDATEWYIEKFGQDFVIKSVKEPAEWFNLRYGNANLMGTYPGTGTDNERFNFYDEFGRKVVDEAGEVTPPVSGEFGTYFDSLRINHKQLVYDEEHTQYFYSLPDSVREGKPFTFKLQAALKADYADYTLTLDDAFMPEGEDIYTLEAPDCETAYPLTLVNPAGETVSQTKLQFTYLPIVEINLSNCNSGDYTLGSIRVNDGNQAGYDSLYHATFKYRGHSSLRYDKKSFNIKLKDAEGNKLDHAFFGLRSDNRWILDAMMIDKSCLRNRVAMELWNDFATPPYYADREPKARTGTRGKFVEVFWNNRYHGLFCMTERIDRKQLDIQKFVPASASAQGKDEVHGLLYKGQEWSYEVFMGHHMGNEYLPGTPPAHYQNRLGEELWTTYEFKYPDYKKEAVEWKPLHDAVHFVATSSQQYFDQNLYKYFDLPVLMDYYLFMDVLLATDNHGKNVYYFAYDNANPKDRVLSIAPWDLDAILGINWESNTDHTTPDWDLDDYIRTYEHGQNTLFIKLRNSQKIHWKKMLAFRYAKLRPTFFETESLIERVSNYADLFASSCADLREEHRWGGFHKDIQGGADYIKNWLRARIETLDKKYGFDPIASSINEATAETYLKIYGKNHALSITCGKAQSVRIYTISGQLVREVRLNEGENTIEGIPAGLYLVGNQKVLVK